MGRARLIVRHPDGTPYGGARRAQEPRIEQNIVVKTADGLDLVGLGGHATDWIGKPPEKDERPKVTTTERMWRRIDDNQMVLVFPAGVEAPIEELAELIGQSQLLAR